METHSLHAILELGISYEQLDSSGFCSTRLLLARLLWSTALVL